MKAKHQSMQAQRNRVYVLFLAGPVVLFLIAYVYSVGYTVNLSLHSWDGLSPVSKFVGFDNYISLFKSARFENTVINNLKWLVFYLLVPTTLGLSIALLLDGKLKGEGIFKTIIFLPYIITPVAVSAVWRWLYVPDGGLFNTLITLVGFEDLTQNWLGDRGVVNFSVMLAALWCATGFSFLVFYSGLKSIPQEYIEAARIDGASPVSIFWNIVLPQLWPSTILVVGLFGIDAMRIFDIVWSMSGGGPARASEVLATQLYDVGFSTFRMGMASAIGVCQLIMAAVLILPYIMYIARRVEDHGE
ncbi:sugar ABC transporter permease [uncultured Cohaesibacter sp.]|uniref:carbohydrate ABC transporter permease n=1 Tax=uncultured Cohaesibacter sp. TaxID=1002546 RepID=UPI0029309312|nr:sugar ABC transporter permease [uncultured Cohaesibacter sp.]